ncbi:MAG: putative metal-binding motif-containing protein [Candidatus Peribacteria bacterium]|nr:MAG: putative metal-binding motif-containing protein [Candidatus Peribacteria bacterium]
MTVCEDKDGDGVSTCDGDCDDNNPDMYSGNFEICDMYDNDCDSVVNEDNNCCTLADVIDIDFGSFVVSPSVQEKRVSYE